MNVNVDAEMMVSRRMSGPSCVMLAVTDKDNWIAHLDDGTRVPLRVLIETPIPNSVDVTWISDPLDVRTEMIVVEHGDELMFVVDTPALAGIPWRYTLSMKIG